MCLLLDWNSNWCREVPPTHIMRTPDPRLCNDYWHVRWESFARFRRMLSSHLFNAMWPQLAPLVQLCAQSSRYVCTVEKLYVSRWDVRLTSTTFPDIQLSTLVVVVCKETLHTEIKHPCERKRFTVILPKTELRLRLMVLSLIDL